MLACFTQVQASGSSWDGSYAAKGGCYCVGEQGRNIDSQIVPTPIGGQSVAQICERVGDGPTLLKVNGKFNYTVYPDAQCGNGPFPDSISSEDDKCMGHLGVSGEDCAIRGPRWDLADAYSKEKKVLQGDAKEISITGGSRHIAPPAKKVSKVDGKKQPGSNASVAEIARNRSDAKKIVRRTSDVNVPETREQIRARQLVHLAAARKRAKLAASAKSETLSESVNSSLPDVVTAAKPETAKSVQSGATVQADASTTASTKASIDSVADATQSAAITKDTPAAVTALKLPTRLRTGVPDFNFIEAAPVTYDFGGAGLSIAASKSSHNRMQYVLMAAAADTYQEAAIGVGTFFTPSKADRITLMVRAGLEYGEFSFRNRFLRADLSDTGAFAALATRFAVTREFELQAGVSYSSFFEGDVIGFGAAFYHLTQKLDLTAKTEIGDNDLFGFGIRYHY